MNSSSNRVFEIMKLERSNLSPPPFQFSPPIQQLQSSDNNSSTLDNKVSPSILLIIIILAIIFFISGLLHLLVRFLLKPPNTRDPDDFGSNNVTALQGQLQQLFHLHDSGVDQTFIDSLPIFHYKEIIGIKDPFDCAVCLCEFVSEDKLRLLPKCSHAFHMDCIDTWLLSHSTCPLCRSSLLALFDTNSNSDGCLLPMPVVCVLESGSNDTSREIGGSGCSTVVDKDSGLLASLVGNSGSGSRRIGDSEFGSSRRKSSCEIRNEVHDNSASNHHQAGDHHQKIVAIKLGKFRNMDGFVGEGSSTAENNSTNSQNRNVGGDGDGSRRCYSMGSFAYVLDETSSLQVPVSSLTKTKKKAIINKKQPLRLGHRSAISEYGSDSRREFNGVEAFATIDQLCSSGGGSKDKDKDKGQSNARLIEKSRKDSFSFSKIWLRGDKKDKGNNPNAAASSKGALSSRFSAQLSTTTAAAGGGVSKSGNIGRSTGNWKSSESFPDQVEIEMEENGGGSDEETQSCYSYDSQAMQQTSSSNRRTLYWLMTKQNKVVDHSSFSSNV